MYANNWRNGVSSTQMLNNLTGAWLLSPMEQAPPTDTEWVLWELSAVFILLAVLEKFPCLYNSQLWLPRQNMISLWNLPSRNVFPHSSGGWHLRQETDMVVLWWGLPSCLEDGCMLPVLSGVEKEGWSVSLCSLSICTCELLVSQQGA